MGFLLPPRWFFACCLGPFLLVALAAVTVTAADVAPRSASPDTIYTLPPILVEAQRVDASSRSAFGVVLDLGARRHRVEDLSGVLSRMVGVRVRQYGGLGSFATVGIRGSSSSQVDVYLDGVLLNDAYTGLSQIGDLPLDGVGRVEVFRGFSPPQLGSSSVGGAINLVPEGSRSAGKADWVSGVEARQSYGSFETSRLAVSLWSEPSPVSLFIHGGRLQSAGDFTFVDDQATPVNPADDATVVRVNNDFESWNLLGRLSAALPGEGEASLSYNGLFREQGVPGVGSRQSVTARSKRESHLVNLKLATPPVFAGRLTPSAGGFVSTANEQFHDPDGDIGIVAQDTDNTFQSYGGSLRASMEGRPLPVMVEGLLETTDERFRPSATLPAPTEGPDRHRTTQRAMVSGDLVLFKEKMVLSLTERFLWQTTEFYDPPQLPWLPPVPEGDIRRRAQTPHIGFRWRPASFLTVKGNWARVFRQPTMLELFGNTGSFTGTPSLDPEEGVNRDIGVVATFEAGRQFRAVFIELVYLDNEIENLIVYFPNSQFTSRPMNINSARISGWEVSFSSLFWNRLRLAGNYARLNGRDTGPIPYYNGNRLPGRPRDEASLAADYAFRRWNVAYEFQWMGPNYLDPANLSLVPGREIHGAAVRWNALDERLVLSAEGRNLTNNQISDVNGFPLPGRSFFVTVAFQSTDKP